MTDNLHLSATATDYVFVEGLKAHCRLGITAEEKNHPQLIKISFRVPVNSRQAAQKDDIESTINYDKIGRWLVERAEEICCDLLETLAHRLADGAKEKFNLPSIELTIKKPEVYSGETCSGITVRR